MVRFGAKESALIVWRGEYWRLLSSVMLHAGVIHIVPNVLIQLRIGGYLNICYGTPKWFFIYFISGFFGEIMSCLIIPDAVGVGSSGALMGMLASWVVWIVFRWDKIPPECRSQRNCQLFTVVAAIVITLATSFMPAVDYAAHAGGAFQGFLWGIVMLGNESEEPTNKKVS
jgi:membrane associated rhomboid family serine protease